MAVGGPQCSQQEIKRRYQFRSFLSQSSLPPSRDLPLLLHAHFINHSPSEARLEEYWFQKARRKLSLKEPLTRPPPVCMEQNCCPAVPMELLPLEPLHIHCSRDSESRLAKDLWQLQQLAPEVQPCPRGVGLLLCRCWAVCGVLRSVWCLAARGGGLVPTATATTSQDFPPPLT